MADLAVIILTHNESLHLGRALELIKPIAREIVVVDSYSTDTTIEIAKSYGANVLQNKFINYATQFQWALDNSTITSTWVMRLDADEEVESDLAAEIIERLPKLDADVVGICLKRKHIFLGRWIRHGGRYPLILLRIWRRGNGRIENRWMDEHMIVWGGRVVTFDGGFADHNINNLSFFIDKHNKYATREALDVLNQQVQIFPREDLGKEGSTSLQAIAKRLIKERIYNRIPFELSALLYFIYRYFLQLGFLDGKEGIIYHFLQGFWYRFLVGAKVLELERAIAHLRDDRDSVRRELERLTGHKLSEVQVD